MAGAGTLLIRADAGTQMGTGHVMRCLALAQAWQEVGGTVYFALASAVPALATRLSAEGMNIIHLSVSPGSASDVAQTTAFAQEVGAAWVMVDGYQFDATYQQAVEEAGLRLLFVDDYGHASHYYADLVLNQNIYADETLYANRESYTRLLLGARYALLRREFWPWRGWRREILPVARKVLVTLGGSDPDNVTLKVLEVLQQVEADDLDVVVIVGGSNPHIDSLESKVKQVSFNVRLVRNVSNMPELMAWADIAISAGGSTCWELAFMGLPSLLLSVADNQRMAVSMLSEIGVALYLQDAIYGDIQCIALEVAALVKDREARAVISQKSLSLIDGFGVTRVLESLN